MRGHAKASSAGSSTRWGNRRGRVVWTVFAVAVCVLVVIVASAGASKGVVSSFGSAGSGDGQFGSFPEEANLLAVNSTGNGSGAAAGDVYVLDAANQRVEQFDRDGAFIRSFGSLSEPRGIAVDQATGNLYVDDQADHDVSAFGSDGTLQGTIGYGVNGGTAAEFCATGCSPGTEGAGAGQLGASLGGIAVDPSSGDLYVADPSSSRVSRFELTLNGSDEVEDAQFVNAFGWGVEDGGAEFQVCTTASACQGGSIGAGVGQFNLSQPTGLAVNSTGTVFTVESSGFFGEPRRVQSFTPAGATYTPAEFAPAILSTTANSEVPTNVQIGAGGDVFVVKKFAAGATPSCPNGSASKAESRILELDPAGTEVKDTLLACAGIDSTSGLAIDPASGRLYLADTSGSRVFVLDEVLAPSATMAPVTSQTSTTATFAGQVNPNGTQTAYRFEYSSDGGSTWTPTLNANVPVGSGTSSVAVQEEVSGLAANTAYQARIVAEHPFGAGTAISAPVAFTTATAAPIVTTAASIASEEEATLHGLIDPQGSNVTTCRFEWGTTPAYGNTVPCAALPGAGQGPKLVSAQLHGLDPHATYYFRLTATSAAGSSQGPARSLATGPGLPDNRAWEMVSPPDKNGGGIIPMAAHTSAAQELAPGEPMALAYNSLAGFGDIRGGGVAFDYLAVRDAAAGRWETHAINPEGDPRTIVDSLTGLAPVYQPELSPDLSRGVTYLAPNRIPLTPDSVPVQKVWNLYLRSDLRDPGPGSYRLVTGCPLCLQSEPPTSLTRVPTMRPWFAAASRDFSHVAFDSPDQLTSDANPLPLLKAYEWADGQVRLIGRVPVSGDRCDDQAGPACEPALSSEVGRGRQMFRADSVSSDGSRILFMAPGDNNHKSQYYMRIGGHASVRVNASEKPGAGTPQPAVLWKSTPDLSHVFFTTSEQLIPSDEDNCSDLYRYDVDPLGPDGLPDPGASHLTRISVDQEPADGICAVALGAIGTSSDGDTVYFTAGPHQLVRGAPPVNDPAASLYRWHDGAIRYIGQVEANDVNKNLGASGGLGIETTSSVSPNGEHLLFSSTSGAHLTGYQHGDCGGDPCQEFYLYSADADNGQGELACVSCNPSGTASPFRPGFEAGASFRSEHFNGGVDNITAHIPHPLSADGRFAFFDSGERLVPEDENNQRDVYRYDSESGQLSLLSSGAEDAAGGSFFLDAAADGTDAFFGTADQLSGWDVDHAYDAYDARIGGGLPEPPAILPSCVGDACQPPPGQLNDPTPSSSSFSGAGNAREGKAKARCPKGKRAVKARGKSRCVKAKKHKHQSKPSKRDANSNRRASR